MNVREIAIQYLKSLNSKERETLSKMAGKGIICCQDYAKKHKLTPEMFTNELKLIFKGE